MTTAPGAILIAAGGTGGHLFPAEALAHALKARGHVVELATDERADRYGHDFPARKVHLIAAATVNGRSPLALAGTALTLGRGTLQALPIVRRLKPAAAIGFGGYPTVPPLVAAKLSGVPILLHEQNAVMGLGNRLLARFATAIATGFPNPGGLGAHAGIAVHTGNPVRPPVVTAASIPYDPPQPGGILRLLVFGGSQGARVFADLVPPAIAALDPALRARLSIVQQTRDEDLARTRSAYAEIGVAAELAPFFTDLPARMAHAHLVVARSGASNCGRARGHRPAVDPGAAAARPRPGPGGERRRHRQGRRRLEFSASRADARAARRRADRSPRRSRTTVGRSQRRPDGGAPRRGRAPRRPRRGRRRPPTDPQPRTLSP